MVTVSPRSDGVAMIPLAYCFATLLPSLAVTVRRLHDTGHSGWWLLWGFVPFGCLVVLVLTLLNGHRGPNQYGPDPKYELPRGRPLSPAARGR
jgi:uncharacterized membrane protein YhaH (DUF805 family)